MKNTIYLILLILPFTVKSQTIDTAYKAFPSCKIVSRTIDVPGYDANQADRIEITYCNIDFASKIMEVNYVFCKLDGTKIYNGIATLNRVQYIDVLSGTHNGTATIFQYLGIKLNIIYQ